MSKKPKVLVRTRDYRVVSTRYEEYVLERSLGKDAMGDTAWGVTTTEDLLRGKNFVRQLGAALEKRALRSAKARVAARKTPRAAR
jgi:hypothetical protein